MQVRVFQPQDTHQVAGLWLKQINEGSPHNDPETVIRAKAAAQPGLFFVGETEKTIIATCMAGYDGHRGWLYSVAVEPEQQGRGHGRQIVEYAIAALRDLGCLKVNLQIRAENHAVEAFYRSLGFVSEPRISMGKVL